MMLSFTIEFNSHFYSSIPEFIVALLSKGINTNCEGPLAVTD